VGSAEPHGRTVLVRYRVVGGPAGVDQRLVLHKDGFVELDEHHRSRDRTTLNVSGPDLNRIHAALDAVPESCWSFRSRISIAIARREIKRLFAPWSDMDLGTSFFELRRGRRRICGETGVETPAEEARMLLDSLRVHAVRHAESTKPTGS